MSDSNVPAICGGIMGIKRYELSEGQWCRIEPMLPSKTSDPGRTAAVAASQSFSAAGDLTLASNWRVSVMRLRSNPALPRLMRESNSAICSSAAPVPGSRAKSRVTAYFTVDARSPARLSRKGLSSGPSPVANAWTRRSRTSAFSSGSCASTNSRALAVSLARSSAM